MQLYDFPFGSRTSGLTLGRAEGFWQAFNHIGEVRCEWSARLMSQRVSSSSGSAVAHRFRIRHRRQPAKDHRFHGEIGAAVLASGQRLRVRIGAHVSVCRGDMSASASRREAVRFG